VDAAKVDAIDAGRSTIGDIAVQRFYPNYDDKAWSYTDCSILAMA